MLISNSLRWLVVVAGAAMLLAVAAACAGETVEVPGETVVVEKVVTETVEVPGETVVVEKEVIRTVEVPGETVTKEVVKEIMVPGETVVVEKEVVKTVEVPGETVTVEVVKEVQVPGETVVVEKEVVKTVEVPGQTVVVEKVVVQEVPGKKYVTDPTNGKVYTAPAYGGTLIYVLDRPPTTCDPTIGEGANFCGSGVVQKLGWMDWGIDRSVNDLTNSKAIPEHLTGALAESWETPDQKTVIFNIRKGVKWHDKAPMNGRELTADDVVFNLHRLTGTGSGFTEPRGAESGLLFLEYESIEATDKYTVVIKVKEPKMDLFTFFIDDNLFFINPPEVLKEHGDIADWKTLVGTGPFELIDFVEGDSLTYSKNPNYWGYDEKYPENRLPYVDQLRGLLIIETATYIAALRAGKVDYLGANVSTMLKSVDQALSLQRTNPEIRTNAFYFRANNAYSFNQTVPPFTDINVRKAMQMSLDLETINDTYFFGLARTEPQGIIASWQKGWTTPYAEWPEEVKAGYRYDPEGAEALLDAAGYPRGADGIRFSTAVNVPSGEIDALHYAEVVTGFWREIGVDVEILSWEGAVHHSNRQAGYDGMRPQVAATPYPPMNMLEWHYPGNFWNTGGWDDPVYNAIVEKARTATTVAELQPLSREGLFYVTKKHWYIWSPMAPWFNFTQPWVQGFAGDHYFAGDNANSVFARLWIDQDMKEAMGR